MLSHFRLTGFAAFSDAAAISLYALLFFRFSPLMSFRACFSVLMPASEHAIRSATAMLILLPCHAISFRFDA